MLKIRIKLLGLALCLTACTAVRSVQSAPSPKPVLPITLNGSLTLLCSSDLHYQSERLQSQVSVVPQMIYNEAITAAMLAQMQEAQPDRIILTGDLVNQGDEQDHQKMAALLRKVNEAVPVRVIPGNHDLAMVTREEFANLYHEFGYDQAYSRDPDSLSYAELTDAGVLLVLLDTNSERPGGSEGTVSDATLKWLQDMGEQARQSGWLMLTFSHHNLLDHTVTASSDIVAAADTVKVLLEQLNVKTHISGHRHTGHIQTDTAGAQSLTEIVLPMPIAWPNTYGCVQISMEGLDYTQETIDVAAWAQTQGLANPDLLDFSAYSVQAQRQVNQSTLDSTLKNAELTPEQRQLMEEVFQRTMFSYRQGQLDQIRAELLAHPGYQAWQALGPDTIWKRWLQALLTNEEQSPGDHIHVEY